MAVLLGVLVVMVAWIAASLLGLFAFSAVCRSGHREDVARGFSDADPARTREAVIAVPQPRSVQVAEEVTQK